MMFATSISINVQCSIATTITKTTSSSTTTTKVISKGESLFLEMGDSALVIDCLYHEERHEKMLNYH